MFTEGPLGAQAMGALYAARYIFTIAQPPSVILKTWLCKVKQCTHPLADTKWEAEDLTRPGSQHRPGAPEAGWALPPKDAGGHLLLMIRKSSLRPSCG